MPGVFLLTYQVLARIRGAVYEPGGRGVRIPPGASLKSMYYWVFAPASTLDKSPLSHQLSAVPAIARRNRHIEAHSSGSARARFVPGPVRPRIPPAHRRRCERRYLLRGLSTSRGPMVPQRAAHRALAHLGANFSSDTTRVLTGARSANALTRTAVGCESRRGVYQ
jgi:hypothetical protein